MIGFDEGQRFLTTYRDRRVVLAPHPDADGLSGAALLHRWLRGPVEVLCPQKGVSVHSEAFQAQLRAAQPEALVVIDQGSRAGAVLPGVPTLVIDHHVPSGIPDGIFTSSSRRLPSECAAHLCYLLIDEPEPQLWLPALGILGDYGATAPFELLQQAKAVYTSTALQETMALVNAARRSSRYDWQNAYRLLRTADDPRLIARGEYPEVAQLRADREEVNRELRRVRHARPYLADPWAVIPFSSPCLVHALLASSWVGRLRFHYVVAANYGYRPGHVHFAVRTASEADLITALRELAPEGLAGEFAHGHRAATGGSVPTSEFTLLLTRMGFTPEQVRTIEHSGRLAA